MKQYSTILAALVAMLAVMSCVENEMAFDTNKNSVEGKSLVTKASTDYYCHEASGFLLEEMEDPFRAKKGDVVTHRAVEFHPRNLEEYMFLINLSEDVFISYIPFGFAPVRNLSASDRCQFRKFPEEKRYSVSYSYFPDNLEEEDASSIELPEDATLPVVYAVWPIEKGIPASIDHTVHYEVSLTKKQSPSRFEGQINLPIKVDMYDNFLGSYVPMTGIKVRVSYGSFYSDFYMNSNGSATIRPLMFDVDLTLSEISQLQVRIIYQNSQFTVSRDSLVTPIQKYLGTAGSLWGVMAYNTTYPTHVSHQDFETKEHDAFQAAYFYFNGNHDFSGFISSSEPGRIIHASTDSLAQHGYHPAETFNIESTPTIYIYKGEIPHRESIATILHELGHIHHHYSNSSFSQLSLLLKESFASYVGWNVGEQYYYTKGYVKPYYWSEINSQGRQDWGPDSAHVYTPIFVDLTDDYNQPSLVDVIEGVPASVINNMGTYATSLVFCKTYLYSFVGTYFTAAELNAYFDYYL